MKIDIDNTYFRVLSNTKNGEVRADTVFHYHQKDDLVWAEYTGGGIVKGQILGKVVNDEYLEFIYQHINTAFELMTGTCKSYPGEVIDGKRTFNESWKWTCRDLSKGESTIIEV
jgi:hypothetical protein